MGPEGVLKSMTICPGAGLVQRGSYWVEFKFDEAGLRTINNDIWPEGA